MKMTLLFIGVFISCTFFFYLGLHSIDNAWNLRYVQNLHGGNWTDCNAYECKTVDDIYMFGMSMTVVGGAGLLSVGLLFSHFRKSSL